MDEYIKREEAMNIAFKSPFFSDSLMEEIKAIPAADVAPVQHGRWIFGKELPCSWGQIPKNKYHLYCSECLEQAFNRSEDNDPDFDVDTSYCPNCGAKMDEKED